MLSPRISLAPLCLPFMLAALPAAGLAQEVSLDAEVLAELEKLGLVGEDAQTAEGTVQVAEFVVKGIRFEDPPPSVPFGKQLTNFRGDLEVLRQVAEDEKIAGLRIKIEGAIDAARSLDVLEGLQLVKAAGKPIVCYAEGLDQKRLEFAAHADLLAVPPMGIISLQAPSVEAFYMKDMLAKLGIALEVLHVGAYKTAFEDMAADEMSAPQRETILCLLQEFHDQTVASIAAGRGLTEDAVEAAYEEFLIRPARAVELGLIDAVMFEDSFERSLPALFDAQEVELVEDYGRPKGPDIEKLLGNPFTMMTNLVKLLDPPAPKLPDGPRIAIVYATGAIVSGKSSTGFDGSVMTMGSETIVEALEQALEDKQVKAVILRVNSPGGSALASDSIWRAVQRVQAEKPVISSMGYVAASGGYWISMGCDSIVAQPSTITGSIGVVSALPNLSGTMKKLGIDVQVVSYGPRADDLTMFSDGPSDFMKATLTSWMESAYADFITKASIGRRMDPEALEQLAQGRVWTGRQALENGLVDQLGGLNDAIALACELGGGLDPLAVPIAEYPRAKDFFSQLEEAMGVLADTPGALIAADLAGLPAACRSLVTIFTDSDLASPDRVQAVLPFAWRVR